MSAIRKYAVAGGTFAVALGIGFVMQNGDVLAARFGDARPATQPPASLPPTHAPVVAVSAHSGPVLPTLASETGPVLTRDSATLPAESAAPVIGALDLPAEGQPPAPLALPEDTAAPVIASADFTAMPPAPPAALPVPPQEAAGPGLLTLPPKVETAPTPAALDLPALEDSAITPPAPAAPSCEVALQAVAMPLGLVSLELSAPCAPGERVTFHHLGMMFSAVTDTEGLAFATVPALTPDAVFIADLGEGRGAVAMANVPGMEGMNRAVLQWQGETGLQLHAREFGADYGDDGDVWAGNPQDLAQLDGGGFLLELGDPAALNPLLAQVYTMPAGAAGEVRLTVEAEVTAANCGREIAAQSLQISPDAEIAAQDLVLTLPDCAATGEFLVLSGMLSDLQLAAN